MNLKKSKMTSLLVLNAGSSSIKYTLFEHNNQIKFYSHNRKFIKLLQFGIRNHMTCAITSTYMCHCKVIPTLSIFVAVYLVYLKVREV